MAELWYYTSEGKQMDPVSEPELKRLAAAGYLKPTDLVWTDGMSKWVRASAAAGLFERALDRAVGGREEGYTSRSDPPAAAAGYSLAEPEPVSDAPRPRRRAEEDDDDDDFDDRPRRRRRRPQGLGTGAKVAIIGGSIAAVLILVVALVIIAMSGGNTRSFSLGMDQKATYSISFQKGKTVEIWVKSTGQSDVDLFIYDPRNVEVVHDDGPSSDCYVRFVPAATQTYSVVVWNRVLAPGVMNQPWRNGSNSGTLTFQESDQGGANVPVLAPPPVNPAGNPAGFQPPVFQPPVPPPRAPGFQPPRPVIPQVPRPAPRPGRR